MPLLLKTLEDNLIAVIDQDATLFKGFGKTQAEVGEKWTDAIHTYAGASLLPAVNPASLDLARRSFYGVFMTIFSGTNGGEIIEQALAVYATICASGMLPPFVGTLPKGDLDFLPVFRLGRQGKNTECARAMAAVIHQWFLTGTAINQTTGAIIPWS